MIRISVIIPVYNAEEHLDKCIQSVLAQTEKDIEVILIDDGSKDKSLDICQFYAEKDQRVRVVHQENAGVSAARNKGITEAIGEYIGFVDSDDWVDTAMYKSMLREADRTEADVVMCDARAVYEDGKIQADTITQLSCNQILKKSDFMPSLLLEMAGSACRCFYKKKRYNDKQQKQNMLQFPLDVKFSEDRIFNLYAFGHANQVSYIKEAYYNRYMNKKSAVHRFHEDYFEACKKSAFGIQIALKEVWNDNKEYQVAYLQQFINGALMAICNYYYKTSTLSNKEKRIAVKKVCSDRILREAINKSEISSRQLKWILEYKINSLILYAKIANFKHGR